jgi:hypothetical protein
MSGTGWIKTKDGIWAMFIKVRPSDGRHIYITKYAHRDWRWSIFPGSSGQAEARGETTNLRDAMRAVA